MPDRFGALFRCPEEATQSINLLNTQTTSLPTAAVKPLISPVQNPKINGADLFTAGTINGTAVTLSWDPPAIGTPFGYTVAMTHDTANSILPVGTPPTTTFPVGTPPGTIVGVDRHSPNFFRYDVEHSKDLDDNTACLLSSGKTYLFLITSLVDGKANMETSPHRSSLPIANAQLISAPITIQ